MINESFPQLDSLAPLSRSESALLLKEVLAGEFTEEELFQFLLALNKRPLHSEEISGFLDEMLRQATPLEISDRAVDTVGTGGDGFNTINISTAAAIVTTAAGARVIKHGNRAASSKTGSADFLEALGIAPSLTPEEVIFSVRKIGIGFAFAPIFHPAMKSLAPARRRLGEPTIFNLLGPLANPAKPKAFAVGVSQESALPVMAQVLADRGSEGFLFRGNEGLDEISVSTSTAILQVHKGEVRSSLFDPKDLGIEEFSIDQLKGGEPKENAEIVENIFKGRRDGAMREAILLNAAASIAAFKGDFFLSTDAQLANGYALAKSALDSGKAWQVVELWRGITNDLLQARSIIAK
jgi:anthranilate phosphoribosyltransferase